ncbi:hypothetical protein N7450_004481 [Penicillium hetheringtonii]|uniref:Fork-head domain-containing protein n=1 Tax=Penicillium hetheringtonii TaxID=911720 RepID=A0AAD6DQ33_9EURO|nr:hypothetical protein N7450_004481 [Penicillium hetheringtonii]
MDSYSSYPNTPAGFPTGQRKHEHHLSLVQTRHQYPDNRDPFQGNGFQSDPWSQNWPEFPRAPGSMASSQHPGHNALWDGPALGTNESSSTSLQTPGAESVYYLVNAGYNPHSVLTTSKAQDGTMSMVFFNLRSTNPMVFTISPGISPMSENSTQSSHQSPSRSLHSISPTNTTVTNLVGRDSSPRTSISEEDPIAEPPYSALIYDSLKDAPERKRTLQEIYEWFKTNTHKDKDPTSKGWQNSIRHNLSMNAVVSKRSKVKMKKKKPVNYWRLTDEAFENGIQSTTRYRKANHRKGQSSDPKTRERRRSGSKGGKAAKNAAKLRNSPQYEQRREQQHDQKPMLHRSFSSAQPHQERMLGPHSSKSDTMSPYLQNPESTTASLLTSNTPDNDVVGCTTMPPGDNSIFYSPADHLVLRVGNGGYYGPALVSNNGFSTHPENTINIQFL